MLIAVNRPIQGDAEAQPLQDLVFVTEDLAVRHPGCDAISVHSMTTGNVLHGGETRTSPSRLAVSPDGRTVVASWGNLGRAGRYLLYLLRSRSDQLRNWDFGGLVFGEPDHPGSPQGGVAVLENGDDVLVATSSTRGPGTPLGDKCVLGCAPYRVRKYRLSEVTFEQDSVTGRVGAARGSMEVPGIAGEILTDPATSDLHIVTDIPTTVVTIDPATMRRTAPDILLAPLVDRPQYGPGSASAWLHADISADGRYLVTNRVEGLEVNIADLYDRQNWTLPIPVNRFDRGFVMGVTISACGTEEYCVAVHRLDRVSVFGFDPEAGLSRLAEAVVASPYPVRELLASEIEHPLPGPSMAYGPIGSIEWADNGTRLVVAVSYGVHDFVVLEYDAQRQELEPLHFLTACARSRNFPNDIVVVPAPPQPPRTATATVTNTVKPSPTATRVSTATPSVSPSASNFPTSTVSPTPVPLHLPLLLREHCDPEHKRADIALVLDTSSSMTGGKLEDAKTAALLFVGMIDLAPGRSQVAVVRYDREADVVRELTREQAAIEAAIRGLQVRSGTHIDKGLLAALGELQSKRHILRNMPVVVLLTDGLHTGVPGEELRAAQDVRDAGIRLYAIGLGDDVDEDVVITMVGDDSRYHHAPDSDDLARIYAEIALDLMCPGKELWGGK
jgi:uncharacterized protein YegL